MRPDIVVVGGGLLGRLLAWRVARTGLRVDLYDAASSRGEDSAAWAAAGMITPTAEAVDTDPELVQMGRHSLALWPKWLAQLPKAVFFRATGTLMVWHREDVGEARRFEKLLAAHSPGVQPRRVDATDLHHLEPALSASFQQALYLPGEGQVDNRELLTALAAGLEDAGARCYWQAPIADDAFPNAEVVLDCRGMGAKRDWPQLRGVRGEIIRLDAPEIELNRMLRLLHPRYAVYVVPRAEGRLVVGATSIESDDRSPISVRGALELLSSAYSMLPALAEARILEFATQVRPALPDNRPGLSYDQTCRVLRVNGLYRHGFLLSPSVVEEVMALLGLPGEMTLSGRWNCLRLEPGTPFDKRAEIREGINTCLSS